MSSINQFTILLTCAILKSGVVFMKKIIIDFDEVICDNEFMQSFNEFFNVDMKPSDFENYYIDASIEDPDTKRAFGEYLVQRNFYRGAKLKEGAAAVIEKLSKKHDVYICTAYYMDYVRELCGKVIEQKYAFVAREMPNFNMKKILFTNSKNVVVGDIIIDDNLNNLLTNKSPQKLLFTSENNARYTEAELRAKNVQRVNGWQEIEKLLLEEDSNK